MTQQSLTHTHTHVEVWNRMCARITNVCLCVCEGYHCQQHGQDVLVDEVLGEVHEDFSIVRLQSRAAGRDRKGLFRIKPIISVYRHNKILVNTGGCEEKPPELPWKGDVFCSTYTSTSTSTRLQPP